MGLFTEKKPYTAVSSDCEALLVTGPEQDPAKLLDLVQLIQESSPASSGGHEAGRFLRKKIKHGSPSEQGRALALVETLVDNGVKTLYLIVETGLGEQLTQLAASHPPHLNADMSKPAKAARRCRHLLQDWSTRKDRNINCLFQRAGLVDRSEHRRNRVSYHPDDDLDADVFGQQRNISPGQHERTHSRPTNDNLQESPSHYESNNPQRTDTDRGRSHRRILSGSSRLESGKANYSQDRKPSSRSPSPINLRGASLETTVATAHNIATRLTNELIVSPRGSKDLSVYYRQAKQLRHRIVKLIHNPSDDVQQYIGQLLNANEELVSALQAHDAVIEKGVSLAANDDYDSLDRSVWGKDDYSIKPVRAPPSPSRLSIASGDESVDLVDPVSRTAGTDRTAGDPFADVFEQLERPKHTPLW